MLQNQKYSNVFSTRYVTYNQIKKIKMKINNKNTATSLNYSYSSNRFKRGPREMLFRRINCRQWTADIKRDRPNVQRI